MADDEALIPIKEFARLFRRNLRACHARAKSGQWQAAIKVDDRWYVQVATRAYHAALRAAGDPIPEHGKKSVRADT